jgi:phosphate transport system substrate-binding protein
MLKNLISIACVILLVGLAAAGGCSTSNSTASDAPATAIKINGAGSTFDGPLFRKWFEQYHQEHPDTVVDYAVVGSGEGTTRFLEETVDFGASDAALTDAQIASVKRGAILVPITAGVIVVAYNPEGMPPHLKLSRDVYVDIFLGKITHWDDPRIAAINPGAKLSAQSIAVVARQDGSGTTFAFTNHLTSASDEWKKGPGVGKTVGWPGHVMLAPGNEGVAAQIQRNPGTIGYVEYGIAKNLGLGMATLQNKSGNFIEPNGSSGLDTLIQTKMPANLRVFTADPEGADSYPIVTYSWLLLYGKYGDQPKLAALKDVVRWCLSDGQQYSESLGYLRLAPHVVKLATQALDSVGP